MKTRDKILIGLAATAGATWGLRAWLRSRRRITLADRVVVITGASSGHGFIVAQQAAEHGAKLVLAARDVQALRQAEAELRVLGARDVLIVPTDVSEREQAEALITRTIERFGRIDVLVNNAGIISVGPLETMTVEDFRRVLATNFWGAVYTSLAALPYMRAQQFGRIANVSSLGGKVAAPHLLPYTTSKFALTGFTEGLRAEAARDNILITGIYPGTMRTGGHTHAWFKGDKEAEYTWFALSDTTPVVSVSAHKTARKLWQAVCDGEPEVVVGWTAKAAVLFHDLFPEWNAELLALADRLLPAPTDVQAPAVQGQNLQGTAPDLLNRAVPPSARPGLS